MTYWLAADVIMGVVMVVGMVVGIVEDGCVLMCSAESTAVVERAVVVAAAQTVVAGLLACLVARRWELLWVATRQAQGCAITQRALRLSTDAHIRTLLMM